jgi:hypothetical protein
MGAAVGLRGDYEAGQLRGLAKRSVDAAQTRRLLALAAIYEGRSRTEAAKIGGVGLQTVRDWVLGAWAQQLGRCPAIVRAHGQRSSSGTRACQRASARFAT